MLHRENIYVLSVYLFHQISNHIGIWVCMKYKAGQWHKAVRCPISSESIVQSSMFIAAGKSAIYTLALVSNNRADSMSCILLFPSLWETALSCSYFQSWL